MCCTLEPAELSKTILYGAETQVNGQIVHVLGYQNSAINRGVGPNAMILPFPAKEPMTRANTLDVSKNKKLLHDYAAVLVSRTRGRLSLGVELNSRGFDVFESGMYTVVLADNASHVSDAMHLVPEEKRPQFHYGVFGAYAKWYPGWPIAICCFDGRIEPEPMLWWYVPKSVESIFLPALDGHDGHIPRLKADVDVDHTLIYGSMISPNGIKVRLSEAVSSELEPFVAKQIVGRTLNMRMPNGDFHLDVKKLNRMEPMPERFPPPGA